MVANLAKGTLGSMAAAARAEHTTRKLGGQSELKGIFVLSVALVGTDTAQIDKGVIVMHQDLRSLFEQIFLAAPFASDLRILFAVEAQVQAAKGSLGLLRRRQGKVDTPRDDLASLEPALVETDANLGLLVAHGHYCTLVLLPYSLLDNNNNNDFFWYLVVLIFMQSDVVTVYVYC
jgi:aminoglycoside phosphotransferase